eukprot:985660-Pelagomonas_calceolata.AAC.1
MYQGKKQRILGTVEGNYMTRGRAGDCGRDGPFHIPPEACLGIQHILWIHSSTSNHSHVSALAVTESDEEAGTLA